MNYTASCTLHDAWIIQ